MARTQRTWTTAVVFMAGVSLYGGYAQAATYYWDADGVATGNNVSGTGLGGTGSWNTTNLNWWLSGGGSDVAWPNNASHTAQFSGTAGTVSLGASLTGNNNMGIVFNAANYIIDLNNFNLAARTISGTNANSATITNSGGSVATFTMGGGAATTTTAANAFTGNLKIVWSPTNGQTNVLTLNNSANSYTGGTQISFGAVAVGDNAALGTGAITVGTNSRVVTGIRSNDANARTIANSLSLAGGDWMQMVYGSASTGDLTFTGTSSIGGATVWEFNVANTNTSFTNTISGGSILRKLGAGKLNLSGTNSFTGGLYIQGGTVVANSLANISTNSAIGSATNTITATSYSILTLANGGTLQYAAINSVGGGAVSTDRLFAVGPGGGIIDSSGDGAINFTNTGLQTPERAGAVTTAATASGTTIKMATATINRLMVGMVVTGTNIPTGTTITGYDTNLSQFTLSQAVTGTGVANGATLNFGYGSRVLTLTGSNTGDNTIAGILQNSATGGGTLGLTKSGAGKWILTGANTYTGATSVTDGTLIVGVGGVGSLGNSTVTVGGSGVLGGSGAIAGLTTIDGKLTPGNSVGTLTVTNNVTLNGTYEAEVNPTTADLLALTDPTNKTLSLGAASVLNILGTLNPNQVYTLASYGALSGTFLTVQVNGVTQGTPTAPGGVGGTHTLVYGSSAITLAIPEPASLVLLGLGGLLMLPRRKRV